MSEKKKAPVLVFDPRNMTPEEITKALQLVRDAERKRIAEEKGETEKPPASSR